MERGKAERAPDAQAPAAPLDDSRLSLTLETLGEILANTDRKIRDPKKFLALGLAIYRIYSDAEAPEQAKDNIIQLYSAAQPLDDE